MLKKSITLLTLLFLSTQLLAQDWPRWRGPKGDGITTESLPEKWPADGPKKVWSQTVGIGYSSPIAVDGKIYMFAQLEGRDTLYCFDESGQQLWKDSDPGGWTRTNDYPGTRATPVIENGKIYTYGGTGDLVARDMGGKQIWRINILKETNAQSRTEGDWGMSSNPLIDAKNVYVQGGNGDAFAVAVDKNTGLVAWKSEKGVGGYAQPILIDVQGTPQLIVFASSGLYSLNPADGKTLWKFPWHTKWDVNAATPIYKDGHLFITSNYGEGCAMLEVTANSAKPLYRNKEVSCRFQPPILEGDVMYANSEGRIKCVKWADGKPTWPSAAPDQAGLGGSLVRLPNQNLLIMTDTGRLILAKATPQSYKRLAETTLFTNSNRGQHWSTPLIYKGKLYAKGVDELACFDFGPAK